MFISNRVIFRDSKFLRVISKALFFPIQNSSATNQEHTSKERTSTCKRRIFLSVSDVARFFLNPNSMQNVPRYFSSLLAQFQNAFSSDLKLVRLLPEKNYQSSSFHKIWQDSKSEAFFHVGVLHDRSSCRT